MTRRILNCLLTTIICAATATATATEAAAGENLDQHCAAWRADPLLLPRTADAAAAWLAQCPDRTRTPHTAHSAQAWLD